MCTKLPIEVDIFTLIYGVLTSGSSIRNEKFSTHNVDKIFLFENRLPTLVENEAFSSWGMSRTTSYGWEREPGVKRPNFYIKYLYFATY